VMRCVGDATLIPFAHKLRWPRQIVPKLEPQLTDLRWRSQRFRCFRQEWRDSGIPGNDVKRQLL
jgi:hypothetical protein